MQRRVSAPCPTGGSCAPAVACECPSRPSPQLAAADLHCLSNAEVESAIHPDTGEFIPLPFRMSMFMPVNLPVTGGMILSGPVRTCYDHCSLFRVLCTSPMRPGPPRTSLTRSVHAGKGPDLLAVAESEL